MNQKFDGIYSLDVLEHIQKKKEKIFLIDFLKMCSFLDKMLLKKTRRTSISIFYLIFEFFGKAEKQHVNLGKYWLRCILGRVLLTWG